MERTAVVFVLLSFCFTSLALECRLVPGSLKQLDVGNGQVFGVNSNNQIYTLYSTSWIQVPGSLKHVSVGPAGVWGVDSNNYIYKLGGGDWVIVPDLNALFFSSRRAFRSGDVTPTTCAGSLNWEQISGGLSMIEVSTDGKVFGVSSIGEVYQRDGVSPSNPTGTGWRQVPSPQKIKHVSYDNGHLWLIGRDDRIMDCTE
ncbi:fish-egg lectin-like [Pygocentrus nattereri]|uniref:fish-egg lectin-like n=1 Tax=Pygocentrus nattereri TaxID=42514 RepID=UPI001891BEE2|nr:fish-egg lectin-like [Pygocentrus nattereri]